MSSRIGFFFFIGLSLGAIVGYKIAVWPAQAAIIGGAIGILLAVLLDRRARAKASDDGGDSGNEHDLSDQ